MRRLLIAAAVLLCTSAASAADLKIGYVDVQFVAHEVQEGKAAAARLQAEANQKRESFDKRRKELEQMKADLDKQSAVLSDEAKKKKYEDFQKAAIEWQNQGGQMEEEFARKQQEATQSLGKRILQIVAEISDRDRFTFVIDKQALLYAPAASDITNDVIRRYDEKFPTTGAPAAPQGKPAPKNKK